MQRGYDRLFGQLDARIEEMSAGMGAMTVTQPARAPFALMPYRPEMKETKCVICLEFFRIGEEVAMLACHHIFHSDCIVKWCVNKPECPVCKFDTINGQPCDYAKHG
jgi:hypothetical protein